ncbi:MAG: hypothetical protein H6816_06925 [Phycisphaerales bacterium]|nr:hypothetical protein [Phycisphaerales bacterium]
MKPAAGILRPTPGTIDIRGRLAALIEVGAGMHGDLTGGEHLSFRRGRGHDPPEIRRKLDDYRRVQRAREVSGHPGEALARACRRLGFSTAAFANPDVLVDEVSAWATP